MRNRIFFVEIYDLLMCVPILWLTIFNGLFLYCLKHVLFTWFTSIPFTKQKINIKSILKLFSFVFSLDYFDQIFIRQLEIDLFV